MFSMELSSYLYIPLIQIMTRINPLLLGIFILFLSRITRFYTI